MKRYLYYLALGSNLGDRDARLDAAIDLLTACGVPGDPASLLAAGCRYATTAQGGPADQPDFLNQAIAIVNALPPEDMLVRTQAIEARAGRPPVGERVRWGPRELDIDLLLAWELAGPIEALSACGDDDRPRDMDPTGSGVPILCDTPGLTLPHPRLHERWFVLRPLADIAASVRHPALGRTIGALLAEIEHHGEAGSHCATSRAGSAAAGEGGRA